MFKHEFPFDPTYGYDLAKLQAVTAPSPPSDFEAFWRDTYEQTRRVPTNVEAKQIYYEEAPHLDAFELHYDSLGEQRCFAWLTVPKDRSFTRGLVASHGYGARGGPDLFPVGPPAAAIYPCARGLGRAMWKSGPKDVPAHVTWGIDSRDTYMHRFNVAELWSAATILLERYPQVEGNVDFAGGSFGGGVGAMVIPWEPRFRKTYLDMPSFGQHPIRLTLQCVGSGEAVRLLHKRKPQVIETLKYYDSATHSLFTKTPTFVSPALFDPAVPPPGQFAVANALKCEKELFIRSAAHFGGWPGEQEEQARLTASLNKWFS